MFRIPTVAEEIIKDTCPTNEMLLFANNVGIQCGIL